MSLTIFNKFTRKTVMGAQAQQTALFNTASRGTLVLSAGSAQGSFEDTVFFQRVSGLVRRRNQFGTGAVSGVELSDVTDTMVRVSAGTPPIDISPHQYRWIGEKPEIAGVTLGKQIAEDTVMDMLNLAILAAKTALLATASNLHDISGSAKCSFKALNAGAAKMGDQAQRLKAWIVHSKVMHDMYDNALTNTEQLFKSDTVNVVQDGFGRIFVITDSPYLVDNPTTPTAYYTLGLVEGAITVRQNDDYDSAIVDGVGTENITRKLQAQWSYMLGQRGFSWDKSNGGASPSNAALGTSTNWDQYGATAKDLPGVLVASQ